MSEKSGFLVAATLVVLGIAYYFLIHRPGQIADECERFFQRGATIQLCIELGGIDAVRERMSR